MRPSNLAVKAQEPEDLLTKGPIYRVFSESREPKVPLKIISCAQCCSNDPRPPNSPRSV